MTYILILLPFCAVSFWMVRSDADQMQAKEVQLMQEKVNRFVQDLEQQYELYNQTAVSLANMPELQPYSMIENPVVAYNGLKTLRTSRMNVTEQLEDVFIYYGEGDIYAATGVSTPEIYFVNSLKTGAGNDETGAALLAKPRAGACVLTSGGLPKFLVQHYPISRNGSRYRVSMNYVIKLTDMQNTLTKLFAGQTTMVRIFLEDDDQEESICFSNQSNNEMQLIPHDAKNDHLYHTETCELSMLGIRVSVMVLEADLYAAVEQSQVYSIAIIAIGFALSTLLSLWFSKRKKQSVDEIEGIINGTMDVDAPSRSSDELRRLNKMVRKLMRERVEFRQSARHYRFLCKQHMTQMLLHGVLADDEAEVRTRLAQVGIAFTEPYFYTVCAAFDCAEASYAELLDAFAGDAVYPYRVGERYVIAFVAGLRELDTSRKMRADLLASLKNVLTLLGAERLQFFVSRPRETLREMQFAYREAVEVMNRHPMYHEAFLCWFWEADMPISRPAIAPDAGIMAQLDAALRDRNPAEAVDRLAALEAENEAVDSEPARVYRRVCVLQAILAAATDDEQRRLMFDASVPVLMNAPRTFYNTLTQTVNRYFRTDDDAAVPFGEIIDYVNRHYVEYELTLGGIAKRFNMNESYLSKVFRTRTGENYSDHVTDLRMAEVRRQLVLTGRNISDIFESVGYVNKTNYSKKFKSYFGCSASEMRKMYQNSGTLPPMPHPERRPASDGEFAVENVPRPEESGADDPESDL